MISIARVSREGDKAIVKSSSGYTVISTASDEVVDGDFSALIASGSWRRPVSSDEELFSDKLSILEGSIVASVDSKPEKERMFRAPKSVREEISLALKEFSALISDNDRETAKRISSGPVTKSDIEWIHTFFSQVDKAQQLRGGVKGARWASKILMPEETLTASVTALSDDLYYYGVGDNPNSREVQALLAVDPNGDLVLEWDNGTFIEVVGQNIADIEEPYIIPIDGETAAHIAQWISSQQDSNPFGYDVYNHDYVERNLYELAASELDFEELDRIGSLVADATGYSEVERSVNAKRQTRGPGGKFGGGGANPPGAKMGALAKARLDKELPLIDPAARIAEWLSEGITASVFSLNDLVNETVTFADETVEEAPAEPEAPAVTETPSSALYFGIVDEVDKTAVLDAVAIRKSEDNQPEAWVRTDGAWVKSDDMLANLQGATPPPVVELAETDTVKQILAQIDSHDKGVEPEVIEKSTSTQLNGFSLPDGALAIYSERDLELAVETVGLTASAAEVSHIRKRARALNRIDVLPADWRKESLAEKGMHMSESPLYGEYGEIVAAGVPGVADTPSDFAAVRRLKNYWMRGKGAAKIRWGTKGDLTRAHRHLAKYVGSGRAWGLAQNMHKELFGVSNTTRDKAVGHYRPRRRKR